MMPFEIIDLLIFFTTLILLSTIFPIMFNFFIIPNIEKRVGCKLKFVGVKFTPWIPGSICYGKGSNVAEYIAYKHFLFNTGINKNKTFAPEKNYILQEVNYDFKQSTKFEIIMSYLLIISSSLMYLTLIIYALIYYF